MPNSPEHPEIKLEPIPTTSRGRPPGVKNKVESWKNTAAYAWKPASKIKIETDPDSIASRIKQRHVNQDDQFKDDAVEPDDSHIGAMCSSENKQGRQYTSSGVQEDWKLRNRCTFSPHPNPSQPFNHDRNTNEGNETNQSFREQRVSNFSSILQGRPPSKHGGQAPGTCSSTTDQRIK